MAFRRYRRAKNAAHTDGSVAKKCKLERQRKKKNILHYFKTRDDEIPQPYHYYSTELCPASPHTCTAIMDMACVQAAQQA